MKVIFHINRVFVFTSKTLQSAEFISEFGWYRGLVSSSKIFGASFFYAAQFKYVKKGKEICMAEKTMQIKQEFLEKLNAVDNMVDLDKLRVD